MHVDLHCHSHFSDGKHSPDYLIEKALANKVSHLAITDHDCTHALGQIHVPHKELTIINGVEISCGWENQEIHILGLLIDPEHEVIRSLLGSQQHKRQLRIQSMHEKLLALGTTGLLSYMQDLPCISYTRSHVADFLIQEKICKNRQKAFKSYLGKRGKIYVAAQWCSLANAIACITEAGGIAVLAHPGRYPLSKRKLESLIDCFRDNGGEAIETSYSNIDPNTRRHLGELAASKSLYASAGSDFHDAAAHWTDIGKFPGFDQSAKKNAIWLHPKWHSLIG